MNERERVRERGGMSSTRKGWMDGVRERGGMSSTGEGWMDGE